MPANVWTVPRGRPGRIVVTARDGAGAPLPLDGTEPLRAQLWAGDRAAEVPGALTAEHEPEAGGRIALAIGAEASGGLAEGLYRFLADVRLGGEWWPWLESTLAIVDSPADAAEAPAAYCSMQDLADAAAWLQGTSARQAATNYATQRAAARAWLDDAILKRIRRSSYRLDLAQAVWTPADGPNEWIADRLAAGALLLTPLIVRAVAIKAAAYVAESRITLADKDPWPARAAALHDDARRALLCLRCGLDLDGDGRADYWIHMGRISLR